MNEKSLSNLKPVTTHEEAVERGRKGGNTPSKKRDIARVLARIKLCNPKCPIFPCLFQPLSKQLEDKCALKQQTPQLQKKFYKICLGNEDDFLLMISEALVRISDNKDLIHYGEKVFRMKWGEKVKNETTIKSDSDINIVEVLKRLKNEGRNCITSDDIAKQ